MTNRPRSLWLSRATVAAVLLAALALAGVAAEGPAGPKVGAEAKDFDLPSLGGERVRLAKLVESGPVVLVVLRGYPGYQCPLCTRQFAAFLAKADEFKAAKARVVFVYPGPSDQLQARAAEFVKGKDYPAHFTVLLDPDYTFTNAYGLRWDAKRETAYPSTFVIDGGRKVTFAKVSTSHGDRSDVNEVVRAVAGK